MILTQISDLIDTDLLGLTNFFVIWLPIGDDEAEGEVQHSINI